MTTESTDGKKVLADGSTKVVHTAAESLKMKTSIKNADGNPIGKTGKGVRLTYTDRFGGQALQLPEMKFEGGGMKIPQNKAVWDGLTSLLEPVKEYLNSDDDDAEPPKCTLSFTKKNGFWDITNVQLGHVGTEGFQDIEKPQFSSGGTGTGGTPYDPSGAIIGKIQNNAIELAVKNAAKGDTFNDVIARATDYIKAADAGLYAELDLVARAYYKATTGSNVPAPAEVVKPEPKKADKKDMSDDDDDEDDDTPF